jgi:hypothetical protein
LEGSSESGLGLFKQLFNFGSVVVLRFVFRTAGSWFFFDQFPFCDRGGFTVVEVNCPIVTIEPTSSVVAPMDLLTFE